MGTALCYAALAGGNPQLGAPTLSPEKVKYPVSDSASLELSADGSAVITFPDVAALPQPMEWSMTFEANGKLLKATHSTAPLVSGEWHIHPLTPEQLYKPQQVKETVLAVKPIAPPAPLTEHPIAPAAAVQMSPVPTTNVAPAAIPATTQMQPGVPPSPPQSLLVAPAAGRPSAVDFRASAADFLAAPGANQGEDQKNEYEIAKAVHPIPLWNPDKDAVHAIPPDAQDKAKLLPVGQRTHAQN